jgi:hypothetical protein
MNWIEKARQAAVDLINNLDELERDLQVWSVKPCDIVDCPRPVVSHGLCSKHYGSWRRARLKEFNVKTLRELPKVVVVDPRQETFPFDGGGANIQF